MADISEDSSWNDGLLMNVFLIMGGGALIILGCTIYAGLVGFCLSLGSFLFFCGLFGEMIDNWGTRDTSVSSNSSKSDD